MPQWILQNNPAGGSNTRLLQHIVHICINDGVKAPCFDVKMEFSSSAENVTSLARFFEMDYQEVLRHVVTRWLSLMPAVERILHSWPSPRSNFLSKEGEQCNKALWHALSPEDAGWFQHAVHIFHTTILKLGMHLYVTVGVGVVEKVTYYTLIDTFFKKSCITYLLFLGETSSFINFALLHSPEHGGAARPFDIWAAQRHSSSLTPEK